jgi:MSHA pilin protein MshA
MKIQSGFTLIELVTVIVILGILAVTAAPKFIEISSDARRASLMQVRGALTEAMNRVNLKSRVENEETIHQNENPEVDGIQTHFGYPVSLEVQSLLNLSDSHWTVLTNNSLAIIVPSSLSDTLTASGIDPQTACNITYEQVSVIPSNVGDIPVIESYLGGC